MPTRSSRATACSTLSGVKSLPRRLGKRSRSTSRSSALCSARSASRRKHRGTSSESTATSSTSTASRRSSSKRKETDPEAASAKLHEALALWRGRPLEEFAYEGFAQVEIARLEELRLACLEERVDADLACGRHSELVGELEALVAEHPHRELLRGQLMLALYRSGRQAEALEAYQEARRVLVEGLGIEPGRSLRELEQAILRQDPSLDLVSATAEAADAARGILLAGEPGIGKSRLADEVIRQARERRACVLVGRCWEAGGAPAYWPWVQSLRMYIEQSEPEALRSQLAAGAADVAQIVPELRELFPDLPEPSLETEGARFRLFDSAGRF